MSKIGRRCWVDGVGGEWRGGAMVCTRLKDVGCSLDMSAVL